MGGTVLYSPPLSSLPLLDKSGAFSRFLPSGDDSNNDDPYARRRDPCHFRCSGTVCPNFCSAGHCARAVKVPCRPHLLSCWMPTSPNGKTGCKGSAEAPPIRLGVAWASPGLTP